MRQTEFPLTLAAAKAHQASQWAIGDALIAECGSPPEFHHGPDGSYAKIEAARACLLKNGVDYAANTLRKIRNVAFRFRPPDRRPVSFCMHQESGTPETLDAIIASLQEREKLSVDYVQEFMRARSGAPRPVKRDVAPDDIAGLVARMTEVLKKQVMAIRVKTIVELMDALGIGLSDLSAPACQLIAARQSVPVDDPGQGVGAVACR